MKIGVYIRISSPEDQKSDKQRAALEMWVKRHGPTAVHWFEDRDGAVNLQRKAFLKLQAGIRGGEISTVVVWKLHRLAHTLREAVNVLADWCERSVRVIAVGQQIDLSVPVGRPLASILFGLAEIELQQAKERQAIGIALAKKRGVYQGRPPRKTRAAPSKALALRNQGLTVTEIAKALGVKERTVYNYLSEDRPE